MQNRNYTSFDLRFSVGKVSKEIRLFYNPFNSQSLTIIVNPFKFRHGFVGKWQGDSCPFLFGILKNSFAGIIEPPLFALHSDIKNTAVFKDYFRLPFR